MALIPLQSKTTLSGISTGIKLIPLNPQRGISTTIKATPITPIKTFTPTYKTTPETYASPKETIAKITSPLQPKEGENIVMKGLKWLGSMVLSAFTPLIQDVSEIHALNEV